MPALATKTSPSTRRLSEVARHVVIPDGIESTGWPAVETRCREWGDEFDEWQRGAGRVILGKRADGTYAATIGGVTLSIPRQVAKTWLVGRIIFALCTLFPGLKVVWTAHRSRTATQTFQKLQALAKRAKVAPYIAGIRTTNGEQEIQFANGSVIMFGAREAGFGRGFDEVDVEVFDEAQILTEKALDDMVAATNQSRHPHGALLFFMGTPPRPIDPGEAFTLRRKKALSGKSKDAVYIECSADPDAKPDDQRQWAIANPSFPHRTPLVSMLRLRENLLSDESWLREALGIWDDAADGKWLVIPKLTWNGHVIDPVRLDRFAVGVAARWPTATHWSVAIAGEAGGRLVVQLVDRKPGRGWVRDRLHQLRDEHDPVAVAMRDKGPSSALHAEMSQDGFTFATPWARSSAAGFAMFYDAVMTGEPLPLGHFGQAELDEAVAAGQRRGAGDGSVWECRGDADVGPIEAATNAVWAWLTYGRDPTSEPLMAWI